MYEGDGVVGRNFRVVAHVGIVFVLGDVDERVAVQTVVGVVVGRIAVYGRDSPSVELVEASVVGCCLWVVAVEVPFVHQTSAVASGTEDGGQRGVLGQEIGASDDGGVALGVDFQSCETSSVALVVAYAGVTAVSTSHQCATTGRADATSGVCLGERGSGACQPVDVGCLDVLVSVASQVSVAHVVGQDEHDVGSFRSGNGCRRVFVVGSRCLMDGKDGPGHEEDVFGCDIVAIYGTC